MITTLEIQPLLGEIVESVCGTVLGWMTQRVDLDETRDRSSALSVAVHVAGTWNGTVILWPSDGFARQAAASMFDLPEGNVTPDDMQDAIAELCNVIAGSLKSVLPGPSSLSLPAVSGGSNDNVFIPRTHLVAHVDFQCAGQAVAVRLLEKTGV